MLHDAVRRAGFPSASIWAPVPHYVATPSNPKCTRAILDKLRELLDLDLDLTDLDIASSAWERSVSDVVAGDADVSSYVDRLEARYDASASEPAWLEDADDDDDDTEEEDWFDEDDIPSGESLAEDFERYLRDQPETSFAPRRACRTTVVQRLCAAATLVFEEYADRSAMPGADGNIRSRRPSEQVFLDSQRPANAPSMAG